MLRGLYHDVRDVVCFQFALFAAACVGPEEQPRQDFLPTAAVSGALNRLQCVKVHPAVFACERLWCMMCACAIRFCRVCVMRIAVYWCGVLHAVCCRSQRGHSQLKNRGCGVRGGSRSPASPAASRSATRLHWCCLCGFDGIEAARPRVGVFYGAKGRSRDQGQRCA